MKILYHKQKQRNITGVIFVDKPMGISSQQAVSRVKRVYHAIKAGHTGSLDPLATGMLPICLGGATKFADYLLSAKKTYRVVAQLGQCTITGDAEGEITQEVVVTEQMRADIDSVLLKFMGTIAQVPPMYSALKHQGQPLYRFARRGEVVARPAREVTIDRIQRFPSAVSHQLTLEVTCSKGTYIRTLIEDIGHALGCGAHVVALRRLQVDAYAPEYMVTLATLETQTTLTELDQLLLPVNTLMDYLPIAKIGVEWIERIQQGVAVPATFSTTTILGKWQIMTHTGQFLGLGERIAHNRIAPKRLLARGEIAWLT